MGSATSYFNTTEETISEEKKDEENKESKETKEIEMEFSTSKIALEFSQLCNDNYLKPIEDPIYKSTLSLSSSTSTIPPFLMPPTDIKQKTLGPREFRIIDLKPDDLIIIPIISKIKSKISKISREWLNLMCKNHHVEIRYSDENGYGEYTIKGERNHPIYFDGYCDQTRTVYEFHGDSWHCSPYYMEKNKKRWDDIQKGNKTCRDVFLDTINREKYILSKGFNIFRVWEHEYNAYLRGDIGGSIGRYVTEDDHKDLMRRMDSLNTK